MKRLAGKQKWRHTCDKARLPRFPNPTRPLRLIHLRPPRHLPPFQFSPWNKRCSCCGCGASSAAATASSPDMSAGSRAVYRLAGQDTPGGRVRGCGRWGCKDWYREV